MKPYQTLYKLEEKVYTTDDNDSKETIDQTVEDYLTEVLARRRNDPFEGGLQGSMLILPSKAGFKVAENNGSATHAHTDETLAQYLDGETVFSGIDTMGKFGQRMGDPHAFFGLDYQGFTCRVLCGKNQLTLAYETNMEEVTAFQLEVIHESIKVARKAMEQGIIDTAIIGYKTQQDTFNMIDRFDEITHDESMQCIDEIESIIETRIEEVKRK